MNTYPHNAENKVIRGSKRAVYDRSTIHDILDAHFMCHVAYNYEGRAICLPMAYARVGERIYLHGSLKNRMMTALLECQSASLTVTHLDGLVLARSAFHHSVNYRCVTVFGSLRRIEARKEKMDALKQIVNQMVPDHWEHIRQPNEKEFNATLVIALTIDYATAKVRAEGVLDEKEDYELPIWAGIIPSRVVYDDPIPDPELPSHVATPPSIQNFIKSQKQ